MELSANSRIETIESLRVLRPFFPEFLQWKPPRVRRVRQSRPWTRNPASHGRRSRREPSQRALTLLLIAFGAGIGFSSISPWSDTGVSASTFEVGTGIYLVIVGVMWSAVGGHLAGRLRTKWTGIHRERGVLSRHRARVAGLEFRDPAQRDDLDREHCVSRKRRGGGGRPLGQAARSINPAQLYVDKLFRPVPGTTASVSAAAPNTPTSARSGFADDSTIKREALLQGQR